MLSVGTQKNHLNGVVHFNETVLLSTQTMFLPIDELEENVNTFLFS